MDQSHSIQPTPIPTPPPVSPPSTPQTVPSPAPASTTQPVPQTTQVAAKVEYASFGKRSLATFLDGIIIGVVSGVISLIGGVAATLSQSETISTIITAIIQLANLVIVFSYYIYFIGSCGQTLGKMALKIRVVKVDSHQAPGYLSAFLREVVGKIISALVLCLGYFWMFWDKKKQTWHDKIANTIVIKA